MSQFQTLVVFILISFLVTVNDAFAADCFDYSIHGWVHQKDQGIVMLLNPGSRSEIQVIFPDSMQGVLKNYLGLRIEVDAPAVCKNKFLCQVYYQEGKIKSYPFSPERRDQMTPLSQKTFPCK